MGVQRWEPGYLLPHSVRIFVLGQDLEQHVSRCMTELKDPHNEIMVFYGVGNHGGGPTKENIESIRRLNDDESFPELVFSTPNQYFAEMERLEVPLPVVHDDLQHHASGCYAAHSGIKQWNRQAENKLSAAEKWSALAERLLVSLIRTITEPPGRTYCSTSSMIFWLAQAWNPLMRMPEHAWGSHVDCRAQSELCDTEVLMEHRHRA